MTNTPPPNELRRAGCPSLHQLRISLMTRANLTKSLVRGSTISCHSCVNYPKSHRATRTTVKPRIVTTGVNQWICLGADSGPSRKDGFNGASFMPGICPRPVPNSLRSMRFPSSQRTFLLDRRNELYLRGCASPDVSHQRQRSFDWLRKIHRQCVCNIVEPCCRRGLFGNGSLRRQRQLNGMRRGL